MRLAHALAAVLCATAVAAVAAGPVAAQPSEAEAAPPADDAFDAAPPADAAAPPAAASSRLTLAQLTARALAGPRVRMAAGDTDAARARTGELTAALLPRITVTGFVGPSPEIRCLDTACTASEPDGFAWSVGGVWSGVGVDLVQPLYAHGKIGPARAAVRAGVRAQAALEDEAAGDAAVEAARAYWGLKLARELRYMLEDGLEQLGRAEERLAERLADGDTEVTIEDQQRLQVILAEARYQLEDARQGEDIALAGVRVIAGDDAADIDEEPLEAIDYSLGTDDDYLARARAGRPQLVAAQEGARAAAALADLEASEYFPVLSLNGNLLYSDATGVDDPPEVIRDDPYHRARASLLLTLTWKLEPWTTRSKVARARATARKAAAQVDLARMGATLDQRTAYAESDRARRRVAAATDGETAARAWVAAVLQADAIGAAETKDLADAYLAWFQMRARLATAIMQWNVATVRLDRATGSIRAAR